MSTPVNLEQYGILAKRIVRNASPGQLYEEAILFDPGSAITNKGALVVRSGEKTGRSPADKRIIRLPQSENDIWWGPINMELDGAPPDVV